MTEENPSREELAQLIAAQVEVLAGQLCQHMPSLANDTDKLAKFCFAKLEQQGECLRILDTSLSAEERERRPWWGYVVVDRKGGELRVKAPKSIDQALTDPNWLFNFVSIVGMLMNPVCRGILEVNGLKVEFFQCDPELPPTGILA